MCAAHLPVGACAVAPRQVVVCYHANLFAAKHVARAQVLAELAEQRVAQRTAETAVQVRCRVARRRLQPQTWQLEVCGQACLLLHHLCGLCLVGQGFGTSKLVEALIWVRKIRGVIIKKTKCSFNVSVDVGIAVLPA
jgi:hypothetical protein